MTKPGFVRHWDNQAKAPYLFNEQTRQLVSYDDEESVKLKCEYVKEHRMAGVMFCNMPVIQKAIHHLPSMKTVKILP